MWGCSIKGASREAAAPSQVFLSSDPHDSTRLYETLSSPSEVLTEFRSLYLRQKVLAAVQSLRRGFPRLGQSGCSFQPT